MRSFILKQTSIGQFHEALRQSAGKDEFAPHPLNAKRFRKIVNDVVRTRKSDAQKRRELREGKTRP